MTNVQKNVFLINHKKMLLTPENSNVALTDKELAYNRRLVASLNMNLQRHGFSLSEEFVSYLTDNCKKNSIIEFAETANTAIKEVIGERKYEPMWPNFPDDIADTSIAEAYLFNLLYYVSAGNIKPNTTPAPFKFDAISAIPCKALGIGTEQTIIGIFTSMATGTVPISDDDAGDFIKYLREDAKLFYEVLAAVRFRKITIKENLARLTALCIWNDCEISSYSWLLNQYKDAKDVMRLASVLSGGDASLATKPHFKSLPRGQRRILMSLLRNISRDSVLEEQMVGNREYWKRFGEFYHPGEYNCKSITEAFGKIRSNEYVPTFESRVEMAVAKKDFASAAALASARPGYLARRLDEFIRKSSGKMQDEVITIFKTTLPKLQTAMLVTIINQMRNRDNISIQTGRANGAGSFVNNRTLEDIPMECRADIYNTCLDELRHRFEESGFKKIYVNDNAKNMRVAISQRKTTRSLHTAPTASVFPLADKNASVIRMFLYWNNPKDKLSGGKYDGTDLDLSVTFVDDEFEKSCSIAYFNPINDEIAAYHSGDIRTTYKKPACEFVDFDINKALTAGYRYAIGTVNVFNGNAFNACDECFCGWMVRDGITGDVFDAKTVENKYNLTAASKQMLMVVFDLKERTSHIGNIGIGSHNGGNVYDEQNAVGMIAKSIVNDNTITIEELAKLWCVDKKLAETIEDADIIISDEKVAVDKTKRVVLRISPFDSNSLQDVLLLGATSGEKEA